jgi:hypothetical protein
MSFMHNSQLVQKYIGDKAQCSRNVVIEAFRKTALALVLLFDTMSVARQIFCTDGIPLLFSIRTGLADNDMDILRVACSVGP